MAIPTSIITYLPNMVNICVGVIDIWWVIRIYEDYVKVKCIFVFDSHVQIKNVKSKNIMVSPLNTLTHLTDVGNICIGMNDRYWVKVQS